MNKLFPIYNILIEGDSGTLNVSLPLSCKMTIKRGTVSGKPQEADLIIYNMERSKRDMIYYDPYCYSEMGRISPRNITITAGYSGYTSIIFRGRIWECYSMRIGVNYETQIKALEGGAFLSNAVLQTPITITDREEILKQSVYKVTPEDAEKYEIKISPKVCEMLPETKRPICVREPTWDFIEENTNLKDVIRYFDGNTINVMLKNEVLSNPKLSGISADTGLIETPKKSQLILSARTIFEPMVLLGQEINLTSQTEPRYNGTYKVVGIQHDVLFSNEVSAQNITTIAMYYNDVFYKI